MKIKRMWLALTFLTFSVSGLWAADHEQPLDCIEELEFPLYPPLARMSRTVGEGSARVTMGQGRIPARVQILRLHPHLAREVEGALKRSVFAAKCGGKEIEIFYSFRLVGEEARQSLVRTHFRPPNHVIVIAQPPVVELIPD